MFLPARLVFATRPGGTGPLVVAAVVAAFVFAATPFLIPEVADRYDISVGVAGAISIAQVGAFAVAAVALPRLLAPSAKVFSGAAMLLVAANVGSAAMSMFPLLLALRLAAGLALGAFTWLVWTEAMQSPRSLARISASGPLTALFGSPVLGLLSTQGDRAMYLALAVASLPLLVIRPSIRPDAARTRRVSRSRSNRVLLGALFLMTFAGASLFVYMAAAARSELELTAFAASLGFSLNAAGGLAGARLASRHRRPGLWLATAGPAAALSILGGHPVFYFLGLAWWGFAFWMGVPGVMQMLAARSLHPAERAGDAQSAMAVGRTFAPVLGGAFADGDGYGVLAVIAGSGLTVAGLAVAGVQEGREQLPPTQPLEIST